MNEHQRPENNPQAHHEVKDANVRYIVIFGIAMAAAVAIAFFVSGKLLKYFESHQSLGAPASATAGGRVLPPVGVPRLQAHPVADLQEYLKTQKEILNSYGWVNQKQGIVRIPIERAMSILLQNGLPVRNSKTPKGMIQPGEVQQYVVPQGYMPQH